MKRVTAAAIAVALIWPAAAAAHGLGGVRDLPLPVWLFYYGGAVVLIVSFVALAVGWREPLFRSTQHRHIPWLDRVLGARALRAVLGAMSFGLLVLVIAAGLVGVSSANLNLAPTFVFVVFWLGLVPVVVLVGDVWPALNPWRAGADGIAWLYGRVARRRWATVRYPERLGRWPAVGLLFAFVTLELAHPNPSDPWILAVAALVYTYVTWMGMAVFGRDAWMRNGEAFSVYFSLLARLSPFAREGTRYVRRAPLAGLADPSDPPSGTLAFVVVMLGSVAFDGVSRTNWWVERLLSIRSGFDSSPVLADLVGMGYNILGLAATCLLVASAYGVAVTVARRLGGVDRSLTGAFTLSLVPIALAYAVAHYFSLLVYQGQYAIALASDPFGWDWNLFGTRDYRPNLALLTPNTIWYVQAASLVTGHVAGLVLAHDRALELFDTSRRAVRTQYPMLVLMVLYTMAGLWLLSTE